MSTTAANQLGELIVRRRAVLGLSQLELSARAAVDIKTVRGLEAGTTQGRERSHSARSRKS
jgi:transcriptional regulator with XRE-family HTH domain